jgi:hypothetical protein
VASGAYLPHADHGTASLATTCGTLRHCRWQRSATGMARTERTARAHQLICTLSVVRRMWPLRMSTYQLSLRSVERERGVEPATFFLASI